MAEKLDYKKEYKELYMPPKKPVLVDVPLMNFVMVDGAGAPDSEEYQSAVSAIYAIAYTIKMSKNGPDKPEGYFEYTVPPLEGLWGGEKFDIKKRDTWEWTSMMRLPEFVTEHVFRWAIDSVKAKKPEVDVSKAIFAEFKEGRCVQMMHIGPFATEPATVEVMHAYMKENNLIDMTGDVRRHHEIYLSDFKKTAPENMKTVLRLPVE